MKKGTTTTQANYGSNRSHSHSHSHSHSTTATYPCPHTTTETPLSPQTTEPEPEPKPEPEPEPEPDESPDLIGSVPLSLAHILCIVSTAFAYGCIMTTLFMITLPLECERIHETHQSTNMPTSVALGLFVALAGLTQLISPLVGQCSDSFVPPTTVMDITPSNDNHNSENDSEELELSRDKGDVNDHVVDHEKNDHHHTRPSSSPSPSEVQRIMIGQRIPYLLLGSVCTLLGIAGQACASAYGFWMRYSVSFFLHMIGLNVMYSMMLALIPDHIPASQTGLANAVLAFLLVTGSVFGFAMFHAPFTNDQAQQIHNMYGVYFCVVMVSTILTCTHAHEQDVALMQQRLGTMTMMMNHHHKHPHKRKRKVKQRKWIEEEEASLLLPNSKSKSKSSTCSTFSSSTSSNSSSSSSTSFSMIMMKKIVHSLLIVPLQHMDWPAVRKAYTIDVQRYPDFALATLSRLFYYCGMSFQTFLLFFVQDVVNVHDHPEQTVARLAMLSQLAGAIACVPVGLVSDQCVAANMRRMAHQTTSTTHHHDASLASSSSSSSSSLHEEQSQELSLLQQQPLQQSMRRQQAHVRVPFIYVSCGLLSVLSVCLLQARTVHHLQLLCLFLGAANGMYLTMDTSLAVDTLMLLPPPPPPPLLEPTSTSTTTITTTTTTIHNVAHTICNDHDHDNNHQDEALAFDSVEDGSGDLGDEEDEDDNNDHDAAAATTTTGSAQLLGVWGVAAFLGATLGPMIGGPVLYLVGSNDHHSDHQGASSSSSAPPSSAESSGREEYSLAGYAVLLSLSSTYFLLSAFVLRFLRK